MEPKRLIFKLDFCLPCADYAHVERGVKFTLPGLYTTVVDGLSLDWRLWMEPKGDDDGDFYMGVRLKTKGWQRQRLTCLVVNE